jgi:hypothetical protein
MPDKEPKKRQPAKDKESHKRDEPGRTGGQAEGKRNPGEQNKRHQEPGRTPGQAEGSEEDGE